MRLTSRAFSAGGEIPRRYTCDDADLSPPLEWDEIPAGTRSLALIVEDPDAPDPEHPRTIFAHWILYNIPPETKQIEEAISGRRALPKGTRIGVNDGHRPGYGGPCPPIGRHRYIHKLYALDTLLPDLGYPTREALLVAMEGHIIAMAELIGTYRRPRA